MNPPFNYNPQTGQVTWKYRSDVPSKINARFAGKPAGYVNQDGYLWLEWTENEVRIRHPAAIVIWFMQTGVWPTDEVDHENRNPLDNRWENLREATRSEQTQNRERRKSRPLPVGVTQRGKRFYAAIAVNKKWMYLGSAATPEAAHQLYLEARERLHPRRPR
jgi:HNH endonuclease